MSVSCLTKAASLLDINGVREELCSIIQATARKSRALLTSQQQTLSANLTRYIDDQNNKNK